MKFWITVTLGIVGVTAVSTILFVGMAGRQAVDVPRLEAAGSSERFEGDFPKAVTGETKRKMKNVGQVKGETEFEIRNEGKIDLDLLRGKLTCTCAGAKLRRKGQATEEGKEFLRLAPGETGILTIHWDASKKIGDVQIGARLGTNDPARRNINYVVQMMVQPAFTAAPMEIHFGAIHSDSRAEKTVRIFSAVHDDLRIKKPKVSSKAFSVRLEPMTERELEGLLAKSGVKAILAINDDLPSGPIVHRLSFETNIEQAPEGELPIFGLVRGDFEAVPPRADFPAVSQDSAHERKIAVFAHGMKPEETLRVGKVQPNFLKVELKRSPRNKVLWTLVVRVPKGVRGGPFRGTVSICDQQGVDRLILPVQGIISGSTVSSIEQQ